jgi:hypothetical protein
VQLVHVHTVILTWLHIISAARACSWLLLPPEYTHMCYDVHGVTLAPHFGGPCSPGEQLQRLAGAGNASASAAVSSSALAVCGGPHQGQGDDEGDVDEGRFPHLSRARELLYECIQVAQDLLRPLSARSFHPRRVAFTSYCTAALPMLLQALLLPPVMPAGPRGCAVCALRLASCGGQLAGYPVNQPQ